MLRKPGRFSIYLPHWLEIRQLWRSDANFNHRVCPTVMPGRPLEALAAARRVGTDPVISKAEENPAWADFVED